MAGFSSGGLGSPSGGAGLPSGSAATGVTPPKPVSVVAQPNSSPGGNGGMTTNAPGQNSQGHLTGPSVPGSTSLVPGQPGYGNPGAPKAPGAAAATDPLAALSPQQILAQATSTVTSSYAPDFTGLNQQATDATNLDQKRAADNLTYVNWLASTGAALVSANAGIMDHLETANQAALSTGVAGISGQAQHGIISGSAQSTYMGAVAAADISRLVVGTQQSNSLAGVAATHTADVVANSLGAQSMLRSQQSSALDSTLKTVASDKTKLLQTQSGDIAKEVARLQGVEINKSEFKANYNAAVGKINAGVAEHNQANKTKLTGIKTAAATADKTRKQRAATAEAGQDVQQVTADKKLKLAALNAKQTRDYRDWQKRLANRKLTDAETLRSYEQANHLGPFRLPKGTTPKATGPGAPQSPTADRAAFAKIEATRQQLARIMASNVDPVRAYHLVAQGGTYYVNAPHPTVNDPHRTAPSPIHVVQAKIDPALLNAAYQLQRPGGGHITTRDLAALNKLGIYGVRQRYKVVAPDTTLQKAGNVLGSL